MTLEERRARRHGLWAVLAAVAIWGSFAAVSVSALEAGVGYLSLSLVVQVLLYLPFLPIVWTRRGRFRSVAQAIRPQSGWVVLAGICSVLRDLCYIFALANAPALQVSVLDALWPIFVVLLAARVMKADRRSFSLLDVFLIVSSFVGASFLWLPDVRSGTASLEFALSAPWWVYLVAVGGAATAAIEVVIVRYVQRKAGVAPTIENAIFITQLPRFVAMVTAIVAIVALQVDVTEVLRAVPQVVFLSLGWTAATIAFTYGIIVHPSPTITSVAYLSPVMNSLVLAIVFADIVLTPVILIGICLIVLANMLLHVSRQNLHAGIATIMLVSWIAVMMSYRPITQDAELALNNAGILTSLFAIVVGFSLWRLGERDRALNLKIANICTEMAEVYRSSTANREGLRAQLDLLLREIMCLLYEPNLREQERHIDRLDDRFDELRRISVRDRDRVRTLQELEGHVREWIVLKAERLSFVEIVTLMATGAMSVFIFLLTREDNFTGDLIAVTMAGTIVFLLFSMFGLDRNKNFLSFAKARQFFPAFNALDLVPYLPRRVLDAGEFSMPSSEWSVRTETAEGDGSLGERQLTPDPAIVRILPYALSFAIAASIILALGQARGFVDLAI